MREIWITVYESTQKYAGPEEGGWFYWTSIPMWIQSTFCHCSIEFAPVLTHKNGCTVQNHVREADAFIKGLTSGYLESFTSKDAEEPEHRKESIFRKHVVRVEEHIPQATGLEPPPYE